MSYKENIILLTLESIKVILQTLFIGHFGRENLWCIVIKNEKILEWGSEEIALPYRSPVDNKIHRYFPDFYIKVQENTGRIKRYLIEVKPHKQTQKPKKPKRQTKNYLREVYEYAKNQAKWKAATEFCEDRLWEFKVMTENELGIK